MLTIFFSVNMSSIVAARIDDAEVREIAALSKESNLDRSTLLKKILRTGMERYRVEVAMEKYRKQEVSMGRAAEIAGISVLEFISRMKSFDVTMSYDVAEFEKDLKGL